MVLLFCATQMQEHRESSRSADQPAEGSRHTPALAPSAAPTHLTKRVLPLLLHSTGYPTLLHYILYPTTVLWPATAAAPPPIVLVLFIDNDVLRASARSPAGGDWSARPPAGGGSGALPPRGDAGAPLSLLGAVASPLPPLLGGEPP